MRECSSCVPAGLTSYRWSAAVTSDPFNCFRSARCRPPRTIALLAELLIVVSCNFRFGMLIFRSILELLMHWLYLVRCIYVTLHPSSFMRNHKIHQLWVLPIGRYSTLQCKSYYTSVAGFLRSSWRTTGRLEKVKTKRKMATRFTHGKKETRAQKVTWGPWVLSHVG